MKHNKVKIKQNKRNLLFFFFFFWNVFLLNVHIWLIANARLQDAAFLAWSWNASWKQNISWMIPWWYYATTLGKHFLSSKTKIITSKIRSLSTISRYFANALTYSFKVFCQIKFIQEIKRSVSSKIGWYDILDKVTSNFEKQLPEVSCG